jgi:phosphoribosylaminoimidazole (AIR) synthetase
MYHTFNMGIGMVLVVSPDSVDTVLRSPTLAGFEPRKIGIIVKGNGKVRMKY